jgi:hypothetical protein
MFDIFEEIPLDKSKIVCHSGGAEGSDTYFSTIGKEFGVTTRAYSYKTRYHSSLDKVEISEEDYLEGINQVNKANRTLARFGISKYMNLLARNWAQVKYSSQTFAIGVIVEPGKKSPKGYYSKSKIQSIDGGTGYAVQMSIDHLREVYVYDQNLFNWFKWSHSAMKFIEIREVPKIAVQNFAGIGTRQINDSGIKSIRDLYENTFK